MNREAAATPDPWITADEAAEHLRMAVGTLYNKIAAGEKIPHRRLGRHLRFRRSELDAWVAGHAGEPAPEPTKAAV